MRRYTASALAVMVILLAACGRQTPVPETTQAVSPSVEDEQIALPKTTQAVSEVPSEAETSTAPSTTQSPPATTTQPPATTTQPPATTSVYLDESTQPPENGSEPFTAKVVRYYHGYVEKAEPKTAVADSRDTLDSFLRTLKDDDPYDTANTVRQEDFAAYTDEWFGTHRLVMIAVQENSGSYRHEVRKVAYTGDGVTVKVKRSAPGVMTCDIAHRLILIELPDTRLQSGDPIELIWE